MRHRTSTWLFASLIALSLLVGACILVLFRASGGKWESITPVAQHDEATTPDSDDPTPAPVATPASEPTPTPVEVPPTEIAVTASPAAPPVVSPALPAEPSPTPREVRLEQPVSELYGVVELGSSGIRGLICHIPADGSGKGRARTVFAYDPRDVRPMVSGVEAASAQAVSELVDSMTTRFRVPADHIHLVGSSGLAEGPTVRSLAEEIRKTTGRELSFVTVHEEARYTLKGMVEGNDIREAAVVDIGGGNTKASFVKVVDGEVLVSTVRFTGGVRATTERVMKQFGAEARPSVDEFRAALDEKLRTEIRNEVCSVVELSPAFATRPELYLTGGISWVMASSLVPPDAIQGEGPELVELRADEIRAWIEAVRADPKRAYEYRRDRVRPGGETFAEENRRNVELNFSPQQIVAGATLLEAVEQCLYFADRRSIRFHRYSIQAWPRAWLEEKVAGSR